ncbi:hypothetical protein [Alteromonas sp. A079]|uniref:hypothetical protein n=1 Tax=Alteromonas sp. A079 TaxID=3410268 RepID=UPI003BA39D1A
MRRTAKSKASVKANDVAKQTHTKKRKGDRKATKRKDKASKDCTMATSPAARQLDSIVLPPKLDTNVVDEAYVKVLEEFDGLSKNKHKLSNDDIQSLSKLLSAGDLYKICLLKILISNKVANSYGMSESQFFKKMFDIDKSVLSRIKNCIRVLIELYGDDYSKYPIVSRDTLLTLYKIMKLSRKADYHVDLKEVWDEAISISKADDRKKVFSRDVKEAALDILPSEIFDQIDMTKIQTEKNDEEDEETPLVTINLELDINHFSFEDAKEQVRNCNSMRSMSNTLKDVVQALDNYGAKLDDANPLNPYDKLITEQEEEFEELFKKHKRELDELEIDIVAYLEGLEKLHSLIAKKVKSSKEQFLKP